MKEGIRVLLERRSVRKYQEKQITNEELKAVITAGRYAPSAKNRQPGLIIAVQDPETLKQLSRINAEIWGLQHTDPFYGAPTVMLVLVKREVPTAVEDGSLILGNMMNAAYALGLGSCWINRIKETFELDEGKALLQKWGIEEDYIGIGSCTLGYASNRHPDALPRTGNEVLFI